MDFPTVLNNFTSKSEGISNPLTPGGANPFTPAGIDPLSNSTVSQLVQSLSSDQLSSLSSNAVDTLTGTQTVDIKGASSFFQGVKDFFSGKALGDYLSRAGFEVFGIIFLIAGLFMLANRTQIEAVAASAFSKVE